MLPLQKTHEVGCFEWEKTTSLYLNETIEGILFNFIKIHVGTW